MPTVLFGSAVARTAIVSWLLGAVRYFAQSLCGILLAGGPEKLFPFLTQPPVKTVLQKYLGRGEFPPFQHVAMFESNFLQVNGMEANCLVVIHNNTFQNPADVAV